LADREPLTSLHVYPTAGGLSGRPIQGGGLGVINALMYRHQRNILRKGHIMNKNISEKKKIQLEISGLILRNTLYIVK
jgi:hypothetical protein